MQRNFSRAYLTLVAVGVLSSASFAELSRPTISGTLEGFNTATGMVTIRTIEGKLLRAHMDKKSRYKMGERDAGPGAFSKGMRVAIRIEGALNESPLQADMLMDWMISEKYVAKHADPPYETPMGKYPSTSGVAGKIKEEDEPKLDKQLGVIANGGKPEGFYDNTTMNEGNKLAVASNLANGAPAPGMPGQQMPGAPGPMVGAGMTAAQQMQAAQMQVANMRAQVMQGTSGANMLDEEGGSSAGMGGPPGMANQGAGGIPVNMQAVIVSCDLSSRMMIVRGANSQVNQNVMISAQAPMPALQPGQTVSISGFQDAQGIIQASSVLPVGH